MPHTTPHPSILALLAEARSASPVQLARSMKHAVYPAISVPSPERSRSQFVEVRMLDALSTLCSMHPLCESVAVSLEAEAEGFCLLFATAQESDVEVRSFMEDCFNHVQSLADSYQAYRSRGPGFDISEDQVFMARKRAFAVLVHRRCYNKFRQVFRTGDFKTFQHTLAPGCRDGTPPAGPAGFYRLTHQCLQAIENLSKFTEPASADEVAEDVLWEIFLQGDWIYWRLFDSSFKQYLNNVVGKSDMSSGLRIKHIHEGFADSAATRILIAASSLASCIASLMTVAGTRTIQRVIANTGRGSLRARWIDSFMVPSIIYRFEDLTASDTPTPAGDPSEPNERASSIQAHPEIILVQHIVDRHIVVRPHIALSQAACHACCAYIVSVNAAHHRDFRIRHCSGTIPATWVCPSGDDASADALVARLTLDLGVLRTQQSAGTPDSAGPQRVYKFFDLSRALDA